MVDIRREEEWARRCISLALGAEVTLHDDGTAAGMFDLEIIYADGRRGAVEVTAAADPESIELWNLINDGARWIEPNIKGGWAVVLYPYARAKRIKRELPGLLMEFEQVGIRRVRDTSWRRGPPEERIAALGISDVFQSETAFRGSIYPTIELPDEKSGGGVADTGDALAGWIGDWVARPSQEHNLVKLRLADTPERHIFVILPSFADAPFSVTDLLMRDLAPLPTIKPNLPHPLTHVWCVSTWSSGSGMRWSPDEGWQRFDKLTRN